MNKSVFEYVSNLDTLIAVVIGAMLATLGALFAELIQDRLNRRRRERDSARFFGEILYSIDRILDRAVESQKIGDPWGSVTRRMFKTALREADVYQRNRERLFDIRDMDLRSRIHAHFISEMFPLEALVEYCEEICAIEDELGSEGLARNRAEKLVLRQAGLIDIRHRSLAVLVDEVEKTHEICTGLQQLGGVDFARAASRDTSALAGVAPALHRQ
ncbi:MAG: hypothetical protein WD076_02405 [Parvularculaceae bacterium]